MLGLGGLVRFWLDLILPQDFLSVGRRTLDHRVDEPFRFVFICRRDHKSWADLDDTGWLLRRQLWVGTVLSVVVHVNRRCTKASLTLLLRAEVILPGAGHPLMLHLRLVVQREVHNSHRSVSLLLTLQRSFLDDLLFWDHTGWLGSLGCRPRVFVLQRLLPLTTLETVIVIVHQYWCRGSGLDLSWNVLAASVERWRRRGRVISPLLAARSLVQSSLIYGWSLLAAMARRLSRLEGLEIWLELLDLHRVGTIFIWNLLGRRVVATPMLVDLVYSFGALEDFKGRLRVMLSARRRYVGARGQIQILGLMNNRSRLNRRPSLSQRFIIVLILEIRNDDERVLIFMTWRLGLRRRHSHSILHPWHGLSLVLLLRGLRKPGLHLARDIAWCLNFIPKLLARALHRYFRLAHCRV